MTDEMATAPRDGSPFIGTTEGGYSMEVRRESGFVGFDGDDASAWVACDEGDHPDCWSEGVCWAINENDQPSDPLVSWRPISTARPTTGETQ